MKRHVWVVTVIIILFISSGVNATFLKPNEDEKRGIESIIECNPAAENWGPQGRQTGNVIEFRDDQIMLINGEPFFPVGLYFMRHDPWNTMNSYIGSPCDLNYYDGNIMHFYGQNLFREFDEETYQEALQCVDNPSFLGWHSVDEPVWQWESSHPQGFPLYADLQEYYDRLQQDDPDHPVWMNFAAADVSDDLDTWIQKRQQYAHAADIISVDIYPKWGPGPGDDQCCTKDGKYCVLDNCELSVVGEYVDVVRDFVVEGQKPVWIVPQAWGDVNEHEIRFQSWQAIIHGATGIMYWARGSGFYSLVMPDAQNVAQELIDLHDVLVAETVAQDVTSTLGIRTMVKQVDGEYYILAVNEFSFPDGVTAEFDLQSLGITQEGYALLVNEDELIEFEGGMFNVYFSPFDTHIIRILDFDIIVDDDREPEWYDETHVRTIQEGVDSAIPGDLVFVYSGTYNENVVIDKSIELLGEDKTRTIIDGGGVKNVVNITTSDVSISGFTITNSGRYEWWNPDGFQWWFTGVSIQAENTTISNSILRNNYNGICSYRKGLGNCTLRGNTIIDNLNFGIYLWESPSSLVTGNTVSGNYFHNIGLQDSSEDTVTDNDITWTTIGDGIWLDNTSSNWIIGNRLKQNQLNGIALIRSTGNIISDNIIDYNFNSGIELRDASTNELYNNNITNHSVGISIQSHGSSTGNSIYHNNLNNTINAIDREEGNAWDCGYQPGWGGGNWWSDYIGEDNAEGPGQDVDGSDGIGDTPYMIDGGSAQDGYPLMEPWNGTSTIHRPEVVYVDDNFDETVIGWQWNAFDTIQQGVDAVADDGLVSVFAGIYEERVMIEKPLDLLGEDRTTTIIEGGGVRDHGVFVDVQDEMVNIRHFTINGSTHGIYLWGADSFNITDNIISNTSNGMFVFGIDRANISGNTIQDNTVGIRLDNYSFGNWVVNNTIQRNTLGIFIPSWTSFTFLNEIYHNNFITNIQHAYDGTYHGNIWDNGYSDLFNPQTDGGNYWDDFEIVVGPKYDAFQGPGQDIGGSDGIIDQGPPLGGVYPYPIFDIGEDNYPFYSIDGWL